MQKNSIQLIVQDSNRGCDIDISLKVDIGQIFRENHTITLTGVPVSVVGPEYEVLLELQRRIIPKIIQMMELQHATGKKIIQKKDKHGRWKFRSVAWKA